MTDQGAEKVVVFSSQIFEVKPKKGGEK